MNKLKKGSIQTYSFTHRKILLNIVIKQVYHFFLQGNKSFYRLLLSYVSHLVKNCCLLTLSKCQIHVKIISFYFPQSATPHYPFPFPSSPTLPCPIPFSSPSNPGPNTRVAMLAESTDFTWHL